MYQNKFTLQIHQHENKQVFQKWKYFLAKGKYIFVLFDVNANYIHANTINTHNKSHNKQHYLSINSFNWTYRAFNRLCQDVKITDSQVKLPIINS